MASTTEAQNGPAAPATLKLRRPVHSEVLLSQNTRLSFVIYQDNNPRIEWTKLDERGNLHSVGFSRIIGAKMSSKNPNMFDIHWIPRSDPDDLEGQLKTISFSFPSSPDSHNRALAFCDAIDCLSHGLTPGSKIPERLLHAFINPYSGVPGKSLEIWNNVKRLFNIAGIRVKEIFTTHQGHAEELSAQLNFDECKDGVVVVSGDGLFHEVVNGLLHRPDWQGALNIPLGIIPAGSGNGMAMSLQAWNPALAALSIIKAHTLPLDTWSVIANNQRRFAVLSIEWGTVASIDFDSESVRFMGGARFHVWSFLKLVNRQHYKAEVSYLPGEENPKDTPNLDRLQDELRSEAIARAVERGQTELARNTILKQLPKDTQEEIQLMKEAKEQTGAPKNEGKQEAPPPIASLSAPAPTLPSENNLPDMGVSSSPQERSETIGQVRDVPASSSNPSFSVPELPHHVETHTNGTHEEQAQTLPLSDAQPDQEDPIEEEAASRPVREDVAELPPLDLKNLPGPPLIHLTQERTDEWKTASGEFMLILALNVTHMAHGVNAAPRASMCDGLIDFEFITKPSRRVLLRMIMAMEKGTHVDDPDVTYVKTRAFTLKPTLYDSKHRLTGVDGERLMCDGVSVEVHPRLLTVFCDVEALTDASAANQHSFLSKELAKLKQQLQEELKEEEDKSPRTTTASAKPREESASLRSSASSSSSPKNE